MLAKLATILAGALILVTVSVFNMWVLAMMWVWYITPTFNIAVPALHIIYGLVLIVTFVSGRESAKDKSYTDLIIVGLSHGIVVLALGWFVHVIFG